MLIRVCDWFCACVAMICFIGMIVLFMLQLAGFDSGHHVRRPETLVQFSSDYGVHPQISYAIPPGTEAALVSGQTPPRPAAGHLDFHQGAAAAASMAHETNSDPSIVPIAY